MSEKQFECEGNEIIQNNEVWAIAYSEYNADVITTALNTLIDENKELKKENEQLQNDATVLIYSNQEYRKKNEELQERNNRQAESLKELRTLIEKEDWKTLKQIIQDIKNEEQLQKEGGECYE